MHISSWYIPLGIEASCKMLLNSTQWFVRNRPNKIWLPTNRHSFKIWLPTDQHSDSYIPPLLRRRYIRVTYWSCSTSLQSLRNVDQSIIQLLNKQAFLNWGADQQKAQSPPFLNCIYQQEHQRQNNSPRSVILHICIILNVTLTFDLLSKTWSRPRSLLIHWNCVWSI